jgi:hypothetical protein
VIPVARKLWLPNLVAMPAAATRGSLHTHAGAAADRAEQRPLWIAAQAGAVEIAVEVFLEVLMARYPVPFAALLARRHPQPAVLRVNILDRHAERRADASEGIDQ